VRLKARRTARTSPTGERPPGKASPRELMNLRKRLEVLEATQIELKNSRDRYAHLHDHSPVACVSLDWTGKIIEANLAAASLFGRIRSALLNRPFIDFVSRADLPRYVQHLQRCRADRGTVGTELHVGGANDIEVPVLMVSTVLPAILWDGVTVYQTALTDLTRRNELKAAILHNQERLQLALSATRAGVWDWDLLSGRSTLSPELCGLVGLKLEPFASASIEDLMAVIHPADHAGARRAIDQVRRRQNSVLHTEFRVRYSRSEIRWVSLMGRGIRDEKGRVVRDEKGRVVRMIGIGLDITERKLAEEIQRKSKLTLEERVLERTRELSAFNSELQRQIARRKRVERQLMEVSEREQVRIGQDLHDGLGQQLTGMRFLASALHEKLADKSLAEAVDAQHLAQLLDQAKSQIRQVARGLHPVSPEPNGLMTALRHLAEGVSQLHGIGCRFECPQPVFIFNSSVATHLYRIAQESLNNAVRHGHARKVTLALAANNGTIRLQVQDDGRGWRLSRRRDQGLGLQIMKYRSEMMGAMLDIRPANPRGVLVCCSVPVARAQPQAPTHEGS
jgi:PAS domain S-box-containing protein